MSRPKKWPTPCTLILTEEVWTSKWTATWYFTRSEEGQCGRRKLREKEASNWYLLIMEISTWWMLMEKSSGQQKQGDASTLLVSNSFLYTHYFNSYTDIFFMKKKIIKGLDYHDENYENFFYSKQLIFFIFISWNFHPCLSDLKAWAKWFGKFAGSWKITWGNGKPVDLTISSHGAITLPGLNFKLQLVASPWKQFPAAKGEQTSVHTLSDKISAEKSAVNLACCRKFRPPKIVVELFCWLKLEIYPLPFNWINQIPVKT